MAYTTIDDGTVNFQATYYMGDASDDRVMTFPGHANCRADLLLFKNRTWYQGWALCSATMGWASQQFLDDPGNASGFNDCVTDISEDGWTMTSGNANGTINNKNGYSHLAYGWRGHGQEYGETQEKTDASATGNIQTSTSATWRNTNAALGIAQVHYQTDTTHAVATMTHGLGEVPEFMFFKRRTYNYPYNVCYWRIYHHKMHTTPEQKQLNFEADAMGDETTWNDTAPTSTIFTLGTNNVHVNSSAHSEDWNNPVAAVKYSGYIFKGIQGFSKFGSYTGNGSADGTFVYTGFKPAMVMMKNTEDNTQWFVFDNYRDQYNPAFKNIHPGDTTSEGTGLTVAIDFLSNGFKQRGTTTTYANRDGHLYVYAAWAENPFATSSGVPTTAK